MGSKKVLVTGSSGLVGIPVVRSLLEKGHTVVPYDIKDGLDVCDYATLTERMAGCDVVVHLAAIPFPHPHKSWREFWHHNVLAVAELAQAAHVCKVKRIVYTSSTTYYGFEDGVSLLGFPFVETDKHISQYMKPSELTKVSLPAISYMQSKVIAENILAVYGLTKRIQIAILRLCPVRGDPYLGLNVYNENVTPAIVRLVETEEKMWYEVFNFANPSVDLIDTTKWDEFWEDEWQYC